MTTKIRDEPSANCSLLLTAEELAHLLRCSLRSVRRADAGGLLLSPVRMGRSVRWRREEIEHWIEAGCPERKTWERITRR